MMLMTLVSLSVFAQYPTTKKIKGTPVVIMTVPQAEKINSKFGMLEDSITALHSKLQMKTKVCQSSKNLSLIKSWWLSVHRGRQICF